MHSGTFGGAVTNPANAIVAMLAALKDKDGRIQAEVPQWLAGGPGETLFAEQLAGRTTFSAREAVVAALRESGDLDGEPTPTQRKANFYERG